MVKTGSPPSRPRLSADAWPAAIYAIGDVHGCFDALIALEQLILADAAQYPGEKWIIMLGDVIDRGPDSAAVIAHLLAATPPGIRRICLTGNHEQLLLDFLESPETHASWLDQGGAETLRSYGVTVDGPPATVPDGLLEDIARNLPEAHLTFLATLPILVHLPGWLFVHAGVRPGIPLDDQTDHDLIWIREPFLSAAAGGDRVVHGHTPVDEPEILPHRIGIDTQCYATGRLTTLRVTPDGQTRLFTVETS